MTSKQEVASEKRGLVNTLKFIVTTPRCLIEIVEGTAAIIIFSTLAVRILIVVLVVGDVSYKVTRWRRSAPGAKLGVGVFSRRSTVARFGLWTAVLFMLVGVGVGTEGLVDWHNSQPLAGQVGSGVGLVTREVRSGSTCVDEAQFTVAGTKYLAKTRVALANCLYVKGDYVPIRYNPTDPASASIELASIDTLLAVELGGAITLLGALGLGGLLLWSKRRPVT